MLTLWLDTETFGTIPIKHGAHRYSEAAEVLLVAIAVDDQPTDVWDVQDLPNWRQDLQALIDGATRVVIHNSAFDRTVLRHCGVTIPVDKIEDTMVLALQHSLPASLGKLCDILGVPQDKAKDKDGRRHIQLFTKPAPKNWKLRRATRETHPDDWNAFIEYARLDVDAMRDVRGRLPRWNATDAEIDLWRIDQGVNDNGIAIDGDLARAAIRAFERTTRSLAARAAALTDGAVTSTTQRAALLSYLRDKRGVETEDLTKASVGELLKGNLDAVARELLEIRQQAAATSPAKYKALLDAVSHDGRLRGTIQFCGAARTGRDCLAEGTPVLVKDDTGRIYEKAIETVSTDDLVWDGEAWVSHEGVVFSGEKDVIEHDGVLATTKHIVYISTTESMTLGEAKQKGLPLWRGNGTQFTS
jgi:DNA polymerase bacteriophage-type